MFFFYHADQVKAVILYLFHFFNRAYACYIITVLECETLCLTKCMILTWGVQISSRQIKGGLFPYAVASAAFWSQTESKHRSCRPKDQTKYAADSIFCFCKPNNYSHHRGDGYFGRSYKSPSLAPDFLFVSTSKHGHLEGWEQTERLFCWTTQSFCILCFVHTLDFFTATHVTLNSSTLPEPCWYHG